MGSRFGLGMGTLFLWLVVALAASADETVELVGVTSARLQWEAATGPVVGYYIIVARDGAPPLVEGMSTDLMGDVEGHYGESLVVQVTAFDVNGMPGPISAASAPIRFVETASGGGGGDAGDPGDGADPGDVPGDPGGDPEPSPPPLVLPAPLDFDVDGRSDVLVRAEDGALTLWRMNGSSVLSAAALGSLGIEWSIAGNGDYDGNGTADVLWREDDTGALAVWTYDGTELSGGTVDLGDLAPTDWRVGGSGDFDGDGRDDVLLFSRIARAVEIVFLDGANVLARTRLEGRGGAWSVVATGDFDGDGLAEAIWRNEISHRLALWHVDGPAKSAIALGDPVEGRRVVGAGDFDDDERADVLLRNISTGSVEVWHLNAAGLAAITPLPAGPGAGWTALGGGDYDGNGLADVLWFDTIGGAIELWLTQGGGIDVASMGATLPAGTTIVGGSIGSDDADFLRWLCDAYYSARHDRRQLRRLGLGRRLTRFAEGVCLDVP